MTDHDHHHEDPDADPLSAGDDLVAAFSLEGEPVRGRIARLGAGSVDDILSRHDHHPLVSRLLGDMLTLTALVGSSLKFDGKLIIQAQSQSPTLTPIGFIVAEYRTNGAIRGYARADNEAVEDLADMVGEDEMPDMVALFGQNATFTMTIDQGEDTEKYQGTVLLDGASLEDAAMTYFNQSEQVPSKIRLATRRMDDGLSHGPWRAGGILMQQMAGDSARGDSSEMWERAGYLFETLSHDELIDPYLSAGSLLFRLFHEEGVRIFEGKPIEATCTCSRERIATLLAQFGEDVTETMVEGDGMINVRCEYCNQNYGFLPDDIGPCDGSVG